MSTETINFSENANFIWSIADLLRGKYKQHEYGKIILPLTVLRRLDCVLEDTKNIVLKMRQEETSMSILLKRLKIELDLNFCNTSQYTFKKLLDDADNLADNLNNYINGFSPNAKEILDYFKFQDEIAKLEKNEILYLIVKSFAGIDLHPSKIGNDTMGYIFEELIRKFAEQSNETAGEHFTPREVITLMADILISCDEKEIYKDNIIKTIYDPACRNPDGMLTVATEQIEDLNRTAKAITFGQEINDETYAISKADILLKGKDPNNLKFGNTLTQDGLKNEKFDYMLCNPPFGVEWKDAEKVVKQENEELGYAGRFGAGYPRISDGQLLFLQHMISKMKDIKDGGSRIGIIFNGSPLFTGDAGSGESNIRQWIIENDWLETIIALPDQLFYNTGISTYIWIITNRKEEKRKGKVQIINAVDFYEKMRKSLGNKRKEISSQYISKISNIYGNFIDTEYSKIFDNEDFGYRRVTIKYENEEGNLQKDTENILLKEDIYEYFEREVKPHLPNSTLDDKNIKIGYEIPVTRYFYKYEKLRPSEEISKELEELEQEISNMLKEVLS